jgi:OOP family OmpA-OmpF porin
MNKKLAFILTMSSFAASAAQTDCNEQDANYKQCDNQTGWYIGGALGFAETDIDQNRINQFFDQAGLDVRQLSVDDDDFGGSLFFGYQFNTNWALEAGYLDFGERTLKFAGQTNDVPTYFDLAEHIYPQSGNGASVSLVGSWPISESIKLSAKVGYFDWSGDYVTFDAQGRQGSDEISGGDLLLGGEINYRLSQKTQLFLGYQKVKLSRDNNDMWSLGLRYYFGDQKQAVVKPKPKPAPQPAAIAKPKDSDNDGIYDSADNCPRSDSAYKVDSRGCTLTSEQSADFALTIHYPNDSAQIDSKYNDKLVALAEFINRYKVTNLTVYGHSSAVGSEAHNIKLSQTRADLVAQTLSTQYNIDSSIIKAVGKGESELKASGNSEQAHQQNRRIELAIEESVMVPVKR